MGFEGIYVSLKHDYSDLVEKTLNVHMVHMRLVFVWGVLLCCFFRFDLLLIVVPSSLTEVYSNQERTKDQTQVYSISIENQTPYTTLKKKHSEGK